MSKKPFYLREFGPLATLFSLPFGLMVAFAIPWSILEGVGTGLAVATVGAGLFGLPFSGLLALTIWLLPRESNT